MNLVFLPTRQFGSVLECPYTDVPMPLGDTSRLNDKGKIKFEFAAAIIQKMLIDRNIMLFGSSDGEHFACLGKTGCAIYPCEAVRSNCVKGGKS